LNLTESQFQLVSTFTAGALSVMLAAAVYFVVMRESVNVKQRPAIIIASMYTGIAAFHYSRILSAWNDAFEYRDGTYVQIRSSIFNSYRYADWLITVPLLVAQLVLVLALEPAMQKRLVRRLGGAAALMVLIGLPGEISDNTGTKMAFWALGCIPFAYLIYVLYFGMTGSLRRQSDTVMRTVSNARMLLVGSWMIYPIIYLVPVMGFDGARGLVGRQIGYTIADVIAKPLFGLFLLRVAQAKQADSDELDLTNAVVPSLSVPSAPSSVPTMPGVPTMTSTPAVPGVPTMPGVPAMSSPTVGAQALGHRVPMPPSSYTANGS
jgi:bacteriorhodopsin